MEELTRDPSRRIPDRDLGERPLEPPAEASATEVGMLGEPLRGDETASFGSSAPTETVSPDDYDVRPSERRFGEGVSTDSPNFQGRPNTSVTEAGDATSAGGGSGQ